MYTYKNCQNMLTKGGIPLTDGSGDCMKNNNGG